MYFRLVFAIIFLIYFFSLGAFPQTTPHDITLQLDQLRSELSLLRSSLDSLRTTQRHATDLQDENLDQLSTSIEARIRELETKIDALARASAPTILNPRISAFINFAARADDKTVLDAEGSTEIQNRAYIRGLEVDFRAPVDPYADAVAIIAFEDEAGLGIHADLEEAYGVLKRLPFFETAPLGMKLKVGKFRAPISVNNKLHMHDLPWSTRPLVISRYLGTEHGEFFESGFNPVGLNVDFFLPSFVPTTTFEMNLGVVRSGELGLSEGRAGKQPAYYGNLTLSNDWNNEHLLVLGGSVYNEPGQSSTRLIGAELTYKWTPAEGGRSQSFVAGGEAFFGRHAYADTSLTQVITKPFGFYGYLQYQLSYWTYIGARVDWLKEPENDELTTRAFSAYLSYYTTEFLRFRLGYQHLQSDALTSDFDRVNSVLFEVNFVFGAHPTEPYWVNR